MDDLSLKQFVDVDARGGRAAPTWRRSRPSTRSPELQELKALARERGGFAPGKSLLDVGCGFGLETLRLARLAGAGGAVAGIDKSADFVADAARAGRRGRAFHRLPDRRRGRPALAGRAASTACGRSGS